MLEEILLYLHNWFCDHKDIISGTFSISDGTIILPVLLDGQYFRICGSVFNDGVHEYPATDLTDEEFTGTIWPLRIPSSLLAIVKEIETWQSEYGSGAALGPYQSESFGGYSYTKASTQSSGDSDSSSAVTWRDAFATRLAGWRKI